MGSEIQVVKANGWTLYQKESSIKQEFELVMFEFSV